MSGRCACQPQIDLAWCIVVLCLRNVGDWFPGSGRPTRESIVLAVVDPRRVIAYLLRRKSTIVKFGAVSGSAVGLYFLLLWLMVEHAGFDTPLLENVANAISMELTIVYNFFMSRAITWKDRARVRGRRLLVQLVQFHAAIGLGVLFRLGLFPLLQHFGVPYLLNAAIGVAVAAVFDFAVYDNLVFKKEAR